MKRTSEFLEAFELSASRRDFLKRSVLMGAAIPVVGSLLAACGDDDDDDDDDAQDEEPTSADGAGDATSAPESEDTPEPEDEESPTEEEEMVEPEAGGSWTVVLNADPDTLDAHTSGAYIVGVVHRYLGDTLLAKGLDNEIYPGLAESYEISDDGLTWTFTLQEGILFHDGAPCDAAAVKASFDRALDPDTMSAVTIGLIGPVESIEVLDSLTMTVTHSEPFAVFLDNMAHPLSSIVNVEQANELGDQYGRNPVCTGPWKFVEWQAGTQIVLERFADYNWGPSFAHDGPAYIEDLTFRVMPEAATAITAFEAGEVDQVEIPPPDVQRVEDSGEYKIVKFFRPGASFLEFNVTAAPFDDLNVRQAFNHAIDRQAVLETALEGLGEPLWGPLPESIWGYWSGMEDYGYQYDPDKARELFAASGWELDGDSLVKDGESFSFTIVSTGSEQWTKAGQVVQAQLKDFGIEMEIQTFEFGTLLERLKAGDYQASFIGYAYASPDIVQLWFHSDNIGSGLTLSQHSDAELDKLIDESRSEMDPDTRLVIYEDIQKFIVDKALWVPLWAAFTTVGMDTRISGEEVHPDGHIHLFEASVQG